MGHGSDDPRRPWPSLPPLGVELPEIWRLDQLAYEPYIVENPCRIRGAVHWLKTADPRVRAGIWIVDPYDVEEPIPFRGHETFQVMDGSGEVVADGRRLMTLQPGDVGCIPDALLTHWWITGPFAKLFVLGGGPR